MAYFVYILKCNDGSLYVGVTNNLERRISEHNISGDTTSYTFSRRPLELLHSVSFNSILRAIEFEKQLKGWSRKKKLAFIHGDWNSVSLLAKKKNPSSRASE